MFQSTPARLIVMRSLLIGTAFFVLAGVRAPAHASDAAFMSRINAAMSKMMVAMDVQPTGDPDRDFVAAMVPHHQGAIDMAISVLRFGHNERLRRLAQEIIVTQQEEIAAMRRAVGEPLPPSVPAPDQM